MLRFLWALSKSKRGATAIEYGLIGALVSTAAIVGMSSLGTSLDTLFTSISPHIQAAIGS